MRRMIRCCASVLALLVVLSGCASLDRAEHYEYQFAHEDGLFPPVRLYFNREQMVSPVVGGMINALRGEIRGTNAFLGSGGFVETPFVIDMQLSWETAMSGASFAGAMVSAGTLGVVPSRHRQQYRLSVGVYADGLMIDSFTLEEQSTTVFSVYNYAETVEGDVHRQVMGNLARRLVEHLDQNAVLPRIPPAELEPQPVRDTI